jgi:hypothetical protein
VALRRTKVLTLLVAAGAAFSDLPAAYGAPSSRELVGTAFADARASAGVHVDTTLWTDSGRARFAADAGVGEGRVTIKLTYATIDVVQLGDIAYARSSSAEGLVHFIGWPSRLASAYSGRWVRYSKARTAYATLTAYTSLAASLAALTPTGSLGAARPTVVAGHGALVIKGKLPPNSPFSDTTLYLTQAAKPLPLREVETGAGKLYEVTVLSDWGEHLTLAAPAGAVAAPRF